MHEVGPLALVVEPHNSSAVLNMVYEHVPFTLLPGIVRTAMERIEARHARTPGLQNDGV